IVEYWKDLASILGGFGQLALGSIALVITMATFFTKRQDVFKTELSKAQFEEIGNLRMTLQQVWVDLYYVSQFKGQLDVMGWGIEDMKTHMPEQYAQYERYKTNSFSVYYKLAMPTYYLFPKWLCKKKVTEHYQAMQKLAPFTLTSTALNKDLIEEYANQTIEFIKFLDEALRKNA
ncbi:hypothetical protein KS884_004611, partial [Vibrio parahaemolyticus]|nr:hypothetical protein [Vibrio parahaemolyticus]